MEPEHSHRTRTVEELMYKKDFEGNDLVIKQETKVCEICQCITAWVLTVVERKPSDEDEKKKEN